MPSTGEDRLHFGIIAQEAEKDMPFVTNRIFHSDGKECQIEHCSCHGKENYTRFVDYSKLGIYACKGVRELHELVKSQQTRIEKLEKLVEKLLENEK